MVKMVENFNYKLFSDDLKLFRSISFKNGALLFQKDLEGLRSWSENNYLPLNYNKFFIIKLI